MAIIKGMFTSASWQQLGSPDVRYIVAWDALDSEWQRDETDRYMAAAENAGARVLLGFSHSRSRYKRVRKTLPSPRRFRKEFLRFRAGYEHRWSDIAADDGLDSFVAEVNVVFGSHPIEPYWVNR